jgi:hypothetical protein
MFMMKNLINPFLVQIIFLVYFYLKLNLIILLFLKGKIKPLYNLLPGNIEFKLWFTSGGCQTFLRCFCCCLEEIRKNNRPDPRFIENVRQGKFVGQKGFVDPDDPSILYVEQPSNSYNNV